MSGLIRRISSVLGAFLLLIVLLPPSPAVADTGAEGTHSSPIEVAFGWLVAVGRSFLSGEAPAPCASGSELVAGPNPWWGCQGTQAGTAGNDLGVGLDPDG